MFLLRHTVYLCLPPILSAPFALTRGIVLPCVLGSWSITRSAYDEKGTSEYHQTFTTSNGWVKIVANAPAEPAATLCRTADWVLDIDGNIYTALLS